MVDVAEAFTTHGKRLLRFILSRVRTAEDAQDILQEIFLRLLVNTEENDITQVSAWLYRAARNKIIDYGRRREEVPFGDSFSEEVRELTDILVDESGGQEKDMVRSIVWARLYEALEELPEEQQQAFIETEMEGRSFKELSATTGVPLKTLLSRKHYAVKHLRARLRDIYDDLLEDD